MLDPRPPYRTRMTCPRCHARDVWVEAPVRASACVPLRALRRVRCRACDAQGTERGPAGSEDVIWDSSAP